MIHFNYSDKNGFSGIQKFLNWKAATFENYISANNGILNNIQILIYQRLQAALNTDSR